MRHEESRMQINCVRLFRLQNPKLASNLIAIPNGGARSAITGAILKAEGVVSGTPDLFLAYPKGQYPGLFIEMKTPKGKIQPSQIEMMGLLRSVGYKCVICRTIEDFMKETNEYLNP